MDEMTNVAVDAMGGDHAPAEIVKGVVEAVNENSRIKVYLTGRQEAIKKELVQYTYHKEQIEIVNAAEVIDTAEPPVMAIRKKKDSSPVWRESPPYVAGTGTVPTPRKTQAVS